jgi:hypothetical protein
MEEKYIAFIHDVRISIHENLQQLSDRKGFASADEQAYIDARIMAYQEMLSIMRASAEACQLPLDEIGL